MATCTTTRPPTPVVQTTAVERTLHMQIDTAPGQAHVLEQGRERGLEPEPGLEQEPEPVREPVTLALAHAPVPRRPIPLPTATETTSPTGRR